MQPDDTRAHLSRRKVLFITGYAENAVVGNGQLEAGMPVLTKPFAIEGLAALISDLIAGGPVAGRRLGAGPPSS